MLNMRNDCILNAQIFIWRKYTLHIYEYILRGLLHNHFNVWLCVKGTPLLNVLRSNLSRDDITIISSQGSIYWSFAFLSILINARIEICCNFTAFSASIKVNNILNMKLWTPVMKTFLMNKIFLTLQQQRFVMITALICWTPCNPYIRILKLITFW